MIRYSYLLLASLLFLLFSCEERDKNGRLLDNATSGQIHIYVDEAVKPLIQQEVDVFQHQYKKAHIEPHYMPGEDAIQRLFNDSTRIVVAARELTPQEEAYFKSKKIHIRSTKIAYDAVSLIVNKSNPDSNLTLAQLSDILHGKIGMWHQLNSKPASSPPRQGVASSSDSIHVVFDNAHSSSLLYLRDYFKLSSFPSNFYALKSDSDVIAYVEKNKQALGVIGVSWISNHKDSGVIDFLRGIKVAGISPPDTAKAHPEAQIDLMPFYQPYQYYVALRYYPLIRPVYVLSREGRAGLGNGFAAFVAGSTGQLIAQMAGVLPSQVQVHIKVSTK